ncbi:MAG: hypothetical protein JO320_08560 [Alphaproteobacteria bacterium]|nr:hypothetical protein [Alphaproteobacteria bacterium]
MPGPEPGADKADAAAPAEETRRARRSVLNRRARRFALLALSTGYAGFVLALVPFG